VGAIGLPTKFMARLESQPTANASTLDYELFVGRTSICVYIVVSYLRFLCY